MKISWGTKLGFFAALFMIFVVSMVVVISRQDVPLVEENYYEKGINYQKEIDNNAMVDSTIGIAYLKEGEYANNPVVQISKGSGGNIKDAELYFYRPSNPELDKKFTLTLNSGKVEMFDVKDFQQGKWKVSFSWKEGDKQFKVEKEFDR
jgi:hypothetical protein